MATSSGATATFTGHYAVLGLELSASPDDVKKAHRRLALKWHPDKVADPHDQIAVKVATQQFQLLQAAFEVLSDQEKRRKYDELRGHQESSRDGEPPWKRTRRRAPSAEGVPAGWAHAKKADLRVPADAPDIAAAVDLLPVSGGTIRVDPGTYVGVIVISKPFVTVMCAGDVGSVVVQGQVVFRECATGAQLRGLVISASCTGGAVDLKGVVGNVTIEDCEVRNQLAAGIIFEGCSGDTAITRCLVRGCKYDGLGLHLLKGHSRHRGSITITESRFEDNGYDGLYLGDPRFSVALRKCRVAGNRRHGVCVRGSELSALEATIFEGNGQEEVFRESLEVRAKAAASSQAREVQVAGLPEGWRAFRTEDNVVYYYDCATGATQWSHPVADTEELSSLADASSQPAVG